MSIFDLYGVLASGLADAKSRVEEITGICLDACESSYHGGAYWRYDNPTIGGIILQPNWDETDLEWTEETFQEYPYLLYVSQIGRDNNLKDLLDTQREIFCHLRRRELA